MKKSIVVALGVFLSLSVATEAVMAEGMSPKVCMSCHNGRTAPEINNLTTEQIATKLMAFKSGTTPGKVMPYQVKRLTDDDIQSIAAAIGGKK